jgi:hypothetical protein
MRATRFNQGIDLSNIIDIVADSYSLIQGNGIVDIRDLFGTGGGGGGTVDAYTKAEVDSSLLLKQNTLNWLTGNSNGKNTISTGEGLLSIAVPYDSGAFLNVMTVNGNGYGATAGAIRIITKVKMEDTLEVSGAITSGGLSVITTSSLSQRLGETLLIAPGYTDTHSLIQRQWWMRNFCYKNPDS